MTRLCYCIEDDCPLPHGSLEFPPGLCVDCGMSVPGGDIICDQCKSAWQTFSFSGDVRRERHPTVQPGDQELYQQDPLCFLSPAETDGVPLRDGEEGPND